MTNVTSISYQELLWEQSLDRYPLTATPDTSVREAIARMNQADASWIFAVEPMPTGRERFVGLFCAQDLLGIVATDTDLDRCPLQTVLRPEAIAIQDSELNNIGTVLARFRQSRCPALPVVSDGEALVGAIPVERLLEVVHAIAQPEPPQPISEQQLYQKQLQTSEAQMRVLIESMRDLILIVDAGTSQIQVMPSYPALAGDPASDPIGQTIEQFFQGPRSEAFIKPVREALTQKQTTKFEYSLWVSNAEVWFDACISPLSDRTVLWIARDITQRKRAEAEVLNALEKERELRELKSQFVSMTSHEFRTPLTIIKSSAQLLERYQWSREEQLQHLNKIQSAVEDTITLLDDILTLGKAEAGKLTFDPASLELLDFCGCLVSELQGTLGQQHRLHFTCGSDRAELYGQMDRKLLQQILTNLLSNGIKYSPPGTLVALSLSLNPSRDGESVIFQVKDSGIGIPPEAQSHLFESFYRARNVGQVPGTGLGLTIVKKCVELHRGTIIWESQAGKGTTFAVILPLSPFGDKS